MTSRVAGLAIVVGLVARLGFALGYWHDKPLTHDEQEYLAYAINIAAGHGFTRVLPGAFEGPSVNEFSRAPLYPAFLSMALRLSPARDSTLPASVPPAVQVVQSLVGACGVWLAWRLGARLGGRTAGQVAAWLMALWPSQVWMSAYALSEVLYAPLVLGATLALGAALDWHGRVPADARRKTSLVVAGLCLGFAALTRSAAFSFLVVGCALTWWRLSFAHAAALALAALLVVAPWTWRNWDAHNRFIPVAADAGVNLWIGNHPLATGEGDLATNTPLKQAYRARIAVHPGSGPEELDRVFAREAAGWLAESPGRLAVLGARKAFYAVVPIGPSYRAHSRAYILASVVPYAIALPLAVAATLGWQAFSRPPVALLALVASAWLLMLVFFPHERYRLPVIDPALVVLTSAWVARRMPSRDQTVVAA